MTVGGCLGAGCNGGCSNDGVAAAVVVTGVGGGCDGVVTVIDVGRGCFWCRGVGGAVIAGVEVRIRLAMNEAPVIPVRVGS